MSDATCTVPDCRKPATRSRRTECEMHYYRKRRTGTYDVAHPQRPARGLCIVDGCQVRDCGPHGYCQKHWTRVRRHGSPQVVLPTGPPAGPDHPSRKTGTITRTAAHERVRRLHGPASRHACVDCGRPAAHWSYDHTDPDEQMDERGNPLSHHPEHYQARCVPCHKAFDLDYLTRGHHTP